MGRWKPLKGIAEAIGGVILIQEPAPPKRGVVAPARYVRMLVKADIDVPAKYGFFVPRRNGGPFWVDLKYERMPNICYRCGRWSHDEGRCQEVAGRGEGRYGPWLRADFSGGGVHSREREGSSAGLSIGSQQEVGSAGEVAMKEVNSGGDISRKQKGDQLGGKAILPFLREVSVDNFKGVDIGIEDDQGRNHGFHGKESVLGLEDTSEHEMVNVFEGIGDKKGKGKVGEEITSFGAGLLTDIKIAYADQPMLGGGGLGNPPGFNIVEVHSKDHMLREDMSTGGEKSVARVKKKKGARLLGLRSEGSKFKSIKSKNTIKKVIEQVRVELDQVGKASGEGEKPSTVLLSVEAADVAQPHREP